jgi:hypothetical protein
MLQEIYDAAKDRRQPSYVGDFMNSFSLAIEEGIDRKIDSCEKIAALLAIASQHYLLNFISSIVAITNNVGVLDDAIRPQSLAEEAMSNFLNEFVDTIPGWQEAMGESFAAIFGSTEFDDLLDIAAARSSQLSEQALNYMSLEDNARFASFIIEHAILGGINKNRDLFFQKASCAALASLPQNISDLCGDNIRVKNLFQKHSHELPEEALIYLKPLRTFLTVMNSDN